DTLAGPVHSNDSFLLCGAPTFGNTANDLIESSDDSAQGFRDASTENNGGGTNYWGCATAGSTSSFRSPLVKNAPILDLPQPNTQLAGQATLSYTGRTTIVFNGATMTVNGGAAIAQPDNGV